MREYGNSRTDTIISIGIVIMIIVVACMLSGCVNRALVDSYDQYLQTAGTEYLQYVSSDQDLDDDDRAIRVTNDKLARETVAKFKQTRWSW